MEIVSLYIHTNTVVEKHVVWGTNLNLAYGEREQLTAENVNLAIFVLFIVDFLHSAMYGNLSLPA